MRARIGRTVYCLSCLLSGLVLALGVWITLTDDKDGFWPMPAFILAAMIVWLAGRISRRVLSEIWDSPRFN